MRNIPQARQDQAAAALKLYQRKRALINAIENLDCIEDAVMIEAIAQAMPAHVWIKPNRTHWRK